MTNEEWKAIEGFDNYEVSTEGNVRNIKKNRLLKPFLGTEGYPTVELYNKGKGKYFRIHRLVAIAFIPNPDNLPVVNHKDESRTNNNVNNLEWCTVEYNNNYGTANERKSKTLSGRTFTEEHKRKISESVKNSKCKRSPLTKKGEQR